mmetsp:Transcript_7384/g.15888  ORF Transcript_7384/g.15888 Transcript_7384/m.15888 type:complete len:306 (+) Transcript_7384:439-1356(+)
MKTTSISIKVLKIKRKRTASILQVKIPQVTDIQVTASMVTLKDMTLMKRAITKKTMKMGMSLIVLENVGNKLPLPIHLVFGFLQILLCLLHEYGLHRRRKSDRNQLDRPLIFFLNTIVMIVLLSKTLKTMQTASTGTVKMPPIMEKNINTLKRAAKDNGQKKPTILTMAEGTMKRLKLPSSPLLFRLFHPQDHCLHGRLRYRVLVFRQLKEDIREPVITITTERSMNALGKWRKCPYKNMSPMDLSWSRKHQSNYACACLIANAHVNQTEFEVREIMGSGTRFGSLWTEKEHRASYWIKTKTKVR